MSEDGIPLADLFRVPMPPPPPPETKADTRCPGPYQMPEARGDSLIDDTPPSRLRALWRAVLCRAAADALGQSRLMDGHGGSEKAHTGRLTLTTHQARNWFTSRDFSEVCAMADVCPQWMGQAVSRARMLVEYGGLSAIAVQRAVEIRLMDARRRDVNRDMGFERCAE